jgi:mRNA interferase MazF
VRGDVYRLNPRHRHGGHQQSGARYAVVLQSDGLSALSTRLVAPTSTSARASLFRPEIDLSGEPTRVMLEQTTVVDAETELGQFAGRLSAEELAEVEGALRLVLGLF